MSGTPGTDYWPYLRDVDRLLGEFDARVHWGKLHFLTREQLLARYPRAADFLALRASLDPDGVFLNDHLRPLFGSRALRVDLVARRGHGCRPVAVRIRRASFTDRSEERARSLSDSTTKHRQPLAR